MEQIGDARAGDDRNPSRRSDEAFAEKMRKLTEKLGEQMAKGQELDQLIRRKLGSLGYEFR
ncbi:MAG: hypothetical protein HQL76_12035 [Magnetococcales bacterium]|nr:hypothetical protein [Magnetococcales bacterium]